MRDWILPTLCTFAFWGFWGFIPKITTRYLLPQDAIVYEVAGGLLVAVLALARVRFQLDFHPIGSALALSTGVLGFLGAFFFLTAVTKGPVSLVSSLSALYPVLTVLLAILFLHETMTLRQGLGVGLAAIAMILVAA